MECLRFDEEKIVSGSSYKEVKVHDIQTGKLIADLAGHRTGVFDVRFLDQIIVSCGRDKVIKGTIYLYLYLCIYVSIYNYIYLHLS